MGLLALRRASLVLGPLLLAASTFFWVDGRYGVTGGVIVALSSATWVYGLVGAWEHLHTRLPAAATAGLVLTLLGTLGGIAFGLQGFFEGVYGITAGESLSAVNQHPVAAWLALWGPGPLFPLSLVLLGGALLWTRLVPRPLAVALLIAGAAFPLSRIGRVDLVAHAVDALLLGTSAWLAACLPSRLPVLTACPQEGSGKPHP
ncbi:hypothetical protein K1T35_02090 [Pseudonocardia sp. DSM 110487]|jgi:hypothetical protein|uniref:hypothetical protein n=1 Tax=Pseudonocardia sp. DSM 110487 TaxID=2865833 RepID=UPI001C69613C|nr:hypothetical protein [Pseudonocardia sp. DSM 110487]QYN36161.1 hypothetical protein K1T35_02090 [Pseudonocardia sp. DSM 110487]